MFGVEIAVGYACAYLVRKARRAGDAADAEVDRVVDAGLERVHGLVTRALGDDPALELAGRQASGQDGVSERTRVRLAGALEEAVESAPDLARELEEALAAVQAAGGVSGLGVTGNVFLGPTAVQSSGQFNTQTNHFGSGS
ncbi:hypothetical protein [Actinacidiphila acididurans]|uniref:Chromosome partitioning protein n=1 Tax=Actinacidiphila acididurans TaxID=2784346 RepID=A0ABS2U2M1_9ACTN|nr:hypothetical protein [Actinacidiphila acididurans]MBM9509461.1 hypothetical protein [Actinacidiphila acididurans]